MSNLYKKNKRNYQRIFLIMLGGFILIVGRLFWLQIVQSNELKTKLSDQVSSMRTLSSPRGSILDRNGKELAVSLLNKSLYVNPYEMSRLNEKKVTDTNHQRLAADLLAPLLKVPANELFQTFISDKYFIWLARTLEPEDYTALNKVIKDNSLRGLYFLDESKRYYPHGSLGSHILGFVGTDDQGLEGLELSYDSLLSGAREYLDIQVDGLGRPIAESVFEKFNPARLHRLYLTIDHNMQYVVERALDTALAQTKVQGASVIVMDPHTGEILALSNRPTFDPNTYWKYPAASFSDRAVSYIYEPGSTFKPIVMGTALEEKIVSATATYNDVGSITVSDRSIQNWDGAGNGVVTYEYVLANSLNTGMVYVGMQIGGEKLNNYVKKFGFGKPTGIELPGEAAGILFDTKEMLPVNLATMSIGQGLAVTPIQLIRALAAFANDGIMVTPHIIKKIERSDGHLIQDETASNPQQVISKETANEIRRIMKMVIDVGGGKTAKIQGYSIAGKTGTAQKLNSSGSGYESGAYIASFVGFAPAEAPRYVVLVMLDNPQGAFYGSQIAAPVFKEIMEQLLALAEIPMDSATAPLPISNKPFRPNKPQTIIPQFKAGNTVVVPDLNGLTYRDVGTILITHKLKFMPTGSGLSFKQSHAPGTVVPLGTIITVDFK